MRVTVNISKTEKDLIYKMSKEPLLGTKKSVVRTAIALGLSKMVKNIHISPPGEGDETFRFNSKTIDPEGIFEVMAFYIVANRMGASINNKKIILAKKEELSQIIGIAFLNGLKELPNSIYKTSFEEHSKLKH
jgi:hypothetical protein